MMKAAAPVPVEIQLPAMHAGQDEIARSLEHYRFVVVACARRFGKTYTGALICVAHALATGGSYMWIAPTFKQAEEGYDVIEALTAPLVQAGYVEHIRSRDMFKFEGGGRVYIRTGSSPHDLRSKGLNGAVLDEAAFMQPEVWTQAIRPSLLITKGWCLMLSTPYGRNWFWDEYTKGESEDGKFADWHSIRKTIFDNPMLTQADIMREKASVTEMVWRQEYMAEFLSDAGLVFRNVHRALVVEPGSMRYLPEHVYVMGVDWGRKDDFTTISVFDVTARRQVEQDRFNMIDWNIQYGRVEAMAKKWKVRLVLAEENAVGETNIAVLRQRGLPIKGFRMMGHNKKALIEDLARAIELEEIELLRDDVIKDELLAFEQNIQSNGHITFSHPWGKHDDTVISLALGYHAIVGSSKVAVKRVRGTGLYRSRGMDKPRRKYGERRLAL